MNQVVNLVTCTTILALLVFAGYALWDSGQVIHEAEAANHQIWRPSGDDSVSFHELQAINPEVFAWLRVYGTGIDYPVTQAGDNAKYVNTNAQGEYSLSGSIFLDYRNDQHFGDFNSVVYGHHMEKSAMFGDLDRFAERDFFDAHRFGDLYFDGARHGVEFFAFIHTDAYDKDIFSAPVGQVDRGALLAAIDGKATHRHAADISIEDRLVLLTTCAASSTNGRDVLVGVIAEETFADPFAQPSLAVNRGSGVDALTGLWPGVRSWWPLGLGLIVAGLVVLLVRIRRPSHTVRAGLAGRRGLDRGLGK
ncbi:MAG: class B sortase [Propionibacteriaceae bacterium]|nr:class B sortase [Propionibacteriaceae bacterium]